ncbi:NAD(P)H-binding protein, partial [Microbacterium sp.]|uniref:NAD(P)H-binding protein n=1 Tax=Microbacterium sp. TaxID=51671 RepID=UPI003A89E5DF
IADSGLEWTIVRFLAPKDGPAKGNLRVGTPGKDKLGAAVTRADIAAYTVAQLDNPATIGAAPQISN